ncbi:hypothetical protein QJS10_CPA02g01039 [Acorus calamus]|uniref:Transcription repressor n=1 Tax=Acorus calamus TaxID=4465 RepID=A0AAV9FB90_ACOCL|nr:hypothetical protein QJS10_CPA02g01039 [Acorus calamus]
MPTTKGFHLRRHATIVDVGCGCRPRRLPKLPSFLTNHLKQPKPPTPPSSQTKPIFSHYKEEEKVVVVEEEEVKKRRRRRRKAAAAAGGYGKVKESVAVVKDSDDPYVDFRNSMLQMIVEKEIYSFEELRELLDCFLSLNSPYHHELIVTAFMEIWNGVFVSAHRKGI